MQGILFQDLLWLFIDYVHFDPSVAAISALDKNLERVAFAWSTLERYIQDNMPVTSSECRVHLQNFSNSLGFKSEGLCILGRRVHVCQQLARRFILYISKP